MNTTNLLLEFICLCNGRSLTPSESHIDLFLNSVGGVLHRELFILFCFYFWEERSTDLKMLGLQIHMINKLRI